MLTKKVWPPSNFALGFVVGKKITDFFGFIESRIDPIPFSGCWIWMEGLNPWGYGTFGLTAFPGMQLAHRLSYTIYKGEIPDRLTLDHLCRVRCCVNPDHLEPVTRVVNIMRGFGLPAILSRRDACIYGHKFTSENTYLQKNGKRVCRECRKRIDRARDGKRIHLGGGKYTRTQRD